MIKVEEKYYKIWITLIKGLGIKKYTNLINKFKTRKNIYYAKKEDLTNHIEKIKINAEKIQEFFPDTTIDSLENSVQKYKDIDAWRDTPVLKESAFDKLQEIMSEAGELTTKAPYDKIVNNSFAEKVS